MSVRLGSHDYFDGRFKEIQKIASLGSNRNIFQKLSGKFLAKLRKLIHKKSHWENKLNKEITQLRDSSLNSKEYNNKIDEFTKGLVDEIKKEAFNEFKEKLPDLKKIVTRLQDLPETKKNQPLLSALNDFNGEKKLDACRALSYLLKYVEEFQSPSSDDGLSDDAKSFNDEIVKLKSVLTSNESASKKIIDLYFTNLITVLEDPWEEKNIFKIGDLLSTSGKEKAQVFSAAKEWAEQMKLQKEKLLKQLNQSMNSYHIKKYGFYQDRVNEVKRILKLQQAELSPKKLEKSYVNFLVDSTASLWSPLSKNLNHIKTDTLTKINANIKDTKKQLKTPHDDAKKLTKNLNVYLKCKEIFEKYWQLDDLKKTVDSKCSMIKKLTKKVNRDSSKNVNKVIKLYIEGKNQELIVNQALEYYALQYSLALIDFELRKPNYNMELKEKPTFADCNKVINKCDDAMFSFNKILKRLQLLPESVPFDFKILGEQPVSSKEIISFANKQLTAFSELRKKASAAIERLENEAMVASIIEAEVQNKGDQEDLEFIKTLPQFEIVKMKDDGNCFFHSSLAWIKGMPADQLIQYKEMTAEQLRISLYNFIKNNPDDFRDSIVLAFQTDIIDFAKAKNEEIGRLLLQKAPDLRNDYLNFRKSMIENPGQSDQLQEKLSGQLTSENNNLVTRYADAMAKNTTFVDLLEVTAMKKMLNIKIGLYSQIYSGANSDLLQGDDNLPTFNVLRLKNKPHFDLLKNKPVETSTTSTIGSS